MVLMVYTSHVHALYVRPDVRCNKSYKCEFGQLKFLIKWEWNLWLYFGCPNIFIVCPIFLFYVPFFFCMSQFLLLVTLPLSLQSDLIVCLGSYFIVCPATDIKGIGKWTNQWKWDFLLTQDQISFYVDTQSFGVKFQFLFIP